VIRRQLGSCAFPPTLRPPSSPFYCTHSLIILLPNRFFTAPLLVAHKVYQFVRIKSVSLQSIQSSSPSSCQAGSNCQVPFSGILIPPKCNTDLNIGYVAKDLTWKHPVFHPTVFDRVAGDTSGLPPVYVV
jgi:hypothetical protein